MKKKVIGLLTVLVIAAYTFTGCGADKKNTATDPAEVSGQTTEGDTTEKGEAEDAASDEKITVRIGYFATQTSTPQVYIAKELGYFSEELGDDAEVELVSFANGPAANEAFIAGELDFIFGIGDLPLLNGWRNGIDTIVISKTGVGGTNRGLVVSNKSGISSVEELTGKNVGVYLGTTYHKSILGILGDHGLSAGDVSLVNIDSFNTGIASLESGELDAYYCASTYYTDYIAENDIGYLLEDSSNYPNYGYFVGTAEFINDNPEVTENLLRAISKANLHIEEDLEDSYKIVADFLGVDEIVAQYSIKYGDYNLELEDKDLQNIYDSEDFLLDIGAAEIPVEDSYIEAHIDTSFIEKIISE